MSDYVIYKDQALLDGQNPVTHVIIMGVGAYDYLNGGTGAKTKLHGGLKQLSSPPASARAFAAWVLDEFNNPDKPLATVSLLISEKGGPATFSHAKLAQPVTVAPATIEHVKKAVREWKGFGDRSEENMVLFYFCGHGVARGLDGLTLLLNDYGASNDAPMEGAVDFAALHRGMSQCKASQQCYFVDACRKVSDIATETSATGDAIIQDKLDRPWDSDWNFAISYATLGGQAAYGRKDKPSYYTEELIKALKGTGANNRNADGKWRVSTGDLNIAVTRGLKMYGPKIKVPLAHQAQFEFHELKGDPIAMAIVYCRPKSDHELATLSCEKGGRQVDSREPNEKEWALFVPFGSYDFFARIDTRSGQSRDNRIWPPYQEVKIEVTS